MFTKLKEKLKTLPKKRVIAAAVVFCVVIGIAVVAFAFKGRITQTVHLASSRSYYEDLRDTLTVEKAEEEVDPYDIQINFEELQQINPDIYAWIKIPETNIDYPILQSATEADDYYLNRTIERVAELPGSIYSEKYTSTAFDDPVSVIYGHTLMDGSMFSELKKYRDKEFFDSNPYFYIYTPTGRLKYQVFAAVAFDDRYLLEAFNFYNPEEFEAYIAELKSSMDGNINPDIPIHAGNFVVTLSTCIDEFPNQRWLVNGILAEDTRQTANTSD